jgi:hypothetical protein
MRVKHEPKSGEQFGCIVFFRICSRFRGAIVPEKKRRSRKHKPFSSAHSDRKEDAPTLHFHQYHEGQYHEGRSRNGSSMVQPWSVSDGCTLLERTTSNHLLHIVDILAIGSLHDQCQKAASVGRGPAKEPMMPGDRRPPYISANTPSFVVLWLPDNSRSHD